jgi:hypothetical protein
MANDRRWAPQSEAQLRARGANSVACMVFVAGMSVAIWMGALWASQSWMSLVR